MDKKYHTNELFQGIPSLELEGLDIRIEDCHFGKGEIVFEEGDKGLDFYLVAEGSVIISKKGRGGNQETLATQARGGFFGEMALMLEYNPRSARATAVEPTVLGRIDEDGLHALLSHSPVTALNLTRVVATRLESANSMFIEKLLHAERLSLVGSMMNSIVHDIRNPIATISMTCDYLDGQTNDPVMVQLAELTRNSVDQMTTMIQELLEFSKGTSKIETRPESVPDLIHTLDQQILNRLAASRIEVRRDIEFAGEIEIDRGRILRVLLNVITNAADAMPGGGRLNLSVRESGGFVEFTLSDTGCGIPPNVLASIFEPFVTHGKAHGTGLGMAIAKSAVEAHNGRIWIESEIGEGATCHIQIPARV